MTLHRYCLSVLLFLVQLLAQILVWPCWLQADVRLPSIISDHMVLLRSASVPICGHADPDAEVIVSLDGKTVRTKAGRDGKWALSLNLADTGGGPFEMIVQGKNTITVSDVLVGAVWLASGQSNMEFLLKLTAGADGEIARSQNPRLREFRVEKITRSQPADDCQGKWMLAGPAAAGEFTAVGYYFGKRLQQTLNAPVGIINASWGGTFCEAWTSREAFHRVASLLAGDDERRNVAREYPRKKKSFVDEFAAWLQANQRLDKPSPAPESFAGEQVPTDDWTSIHLPGKIAAAGLPANGVIWIRKEIEVPAEAVSPGQVFKIQLGQLEGFEQVYWNGKKVSETTYERYPGLGYSRYFGISPDLVRTGRNTIAVRIYVPAVSPSISVAPQAFNAGPISLVGPWQAKAEFAWPALAPDVIVNCPQPPKRPPSMMAGDIFNGVVNPLIPYALSGILWYQGESNTGRAYQYRVSFPLLIEDWRRHWHQADLSFYFCQLAAYGPKRTSPGESEWAELREAQSLALKLPNTGQTVLIDVGEAGDIHPRNKRDVGERLARLALAKQYGRKGVFSGPEYESMTVEGTKVCVKFRHTEGGLVARALPATYDVISKIGKSAPLLRNSPHSELEGFSICGADHRWVWADAKIEGDSAVVWSNQVPSPVAVRYAWADNPTCNLFNGAELPASPFRTDDFPAVTAQRQYGPGS